MNSTVEFVGPFSAVPANPEDRTLIEDYNGEVVCFVEGFGNTNGHGLDHIEDFEYAKHFAKELNAGTWDAEEMQQVVLNALNDIAELRESGGLRKNHGANCDCFSCEPEVTGRFE